MSKGVDFFLFLFSFWLTYPNIAACKDLVFINMSMYILPFGVGSFGKQH